MENKEIEHQVSPILPREQPTVPPSVQTTNLLQGWPSSPKPVEFSTISIVSDLFVDIVLLGASVAFLVFALVVNHYDQALTTLHPRAADTLLNAAKYGPTVFPILFAAVLGRATHAILLWRLEKGERIGVLDILAGSTSLTSTITSQLKLRIASFLGLALLAIWALSPVGGQASFRQVAIGSRITSQPASFTYMVLSGNMWGFSETSRSTYWGIVNAHFIASILAPAATKSSPLDTWGNVKIPSIEQYENMSTANSEGWFITHDGNETTYSSIVGYPISGTNASEFIDYDFNIETSYLLLNCPIANTTWDGVVPENVTNFLGTGAYFWWSDNTTQRGLADPNELEPFNFTYVGWGSTGLSQCTITTTYIEVGVSCPTSSTCAASRLRRSRLSHPPPAYTLLDMPSWGDKENWYFFVEAFVKASQSHTGVPTLIDDYVMAPENPTTSGGSEPLTPESYALRLGQLINAYWTCINGIFAISGGMTPATARMDGNYTVDTSSSEKNLLANASTIEGTKKTEVEVIKAHKGWVAALSVASIAMVIASLVHPIVRYFLTQTPDLALNISGLATRNNPYIPLPVNGTYMDAAERANLVKNVRVRFGDVEANSEIGNLAISSLNAFGEPKMAGLRKGRTFE